MDRYSFDYEIAKFRSYKKYSKILFTTKRKDVFCFGAVKMAHISKKYDWNPGSMMNDNHDFEVYSKCFGMENMLNGDSVTLTLPSKVPLDDFLFFARPTKDTKLFTGGVFTHESWDDLWERLKVNKHKFEGSNVIVAPCKDIQQEVGCWVVGEIY